MNPPYYTPSEKTRKKFPNGRELRSAGKSVSRREYRERRRREETECSPSVIMFEATGSPNSSQASFREAKEASHSVSSFDLGDEKTSF